MTPQPVPGAPPSMPRARVSEVDVLRGVALLSMFTAHCCGWPQHAGWVGLTDYLTAPLFAALIGMSAQLAWARASGPAAAAPASVRGPRGWVAYPPARLGVRDCDVASQQTRSWLGPPRVASAIVRACALAVLGVMLAGAGAQLDVVLAYLAVLTIVCLPIVRLQAGALVALAGVAALVAHPLMSALKPVRDADPGRWLLFDILATGEHYRLATLVVAAVIGILIVRHLRPATNVTLLITGATSLAIATVIVGLGQAQVISVRPYSGTLFETVVANCLVITVSSACFAAVRTFVGRPRLARYRVTGPLRLMGRMSLTLYTLQVLWLAYVAHVHPGRSSQSWADLVLLGLGSAAFATAWRALPLRGAFTRGPLEGVIGAIVALATAPRPRSRPRPRQRAYSPTVTWTPSPPPRRAGLPFSMPSRMRAFRRTVIVNARRSAPRTTTSRQPRRPAGRN